MSLKNTKTEEIYKDAYITVYDRYDEPIKSFDSIDSLLQMFTDIDLTQRMTIDRKEEKITPMYIVGTINDGKFKQALHYEGHSGNRLFSRKRDAVNFYSQEKNEYPEHEIHIYEITQVSDYTEDIENDEKALEKPEFPIIEYIKKMD